MFRSFGGLVLHIQCGVCMGCRHLVRVPRDRGVTFRELSSLEYLSALTKRCGSFIKHDPSIRKHLSRTSHFVEASKYAFKFIPTGGEIGYGNAARWADKVKVGGIPMYGYVDTGDEVKMKWLVGPRMEAVSIPTVDTLVSQLGNPLTVLRHAFQVVIDHRVSVLKPNGTKSLIGENALRKMSLKAVYWSSMFINDQYDVPGTRVISLEKLQENYSRHQELSAAPLPSESYPVPMAGAFKRRKDESKKDGKAAFINDKVSCRRRDLSAEMIQALQLGSGENLPGDNTKSSNIGYPNIEHWNNALSEAMGVRVRKLKGLVNEKPATSLKEIKTESEVASEFLRRESFDFTYPTGDDVRGWWYTTEIEVEDINEIYTVPDMTVKILLCWQQQMEAGEDGTTTAWVYVGNEVVGVARRTEELADIMAALADED